MPFAEDQDAVGELGSGGQDEAFGVAVRPRSDSEQWVGPLDELTVTIRSNLAHSPDFPKIMSTRVPESGV